MASILVFGAGSIGGVYTYTFLQAGAQVTAICRSNYDAVKNDGFMMYSKKFGDVQFRPDVVRSAEEAAGKSWDYILVCSKSFPGSKPSLADQIRAAVGRSTAIVLVQNGIQIEQEVAEAFPENPILSCVVYMPATQIEPGIIHYTEVLNLLEIGTFPSNAPESHKQAALKLEELVIRGGGDAKVYEDVQPLRWSKLIINASWNPISALSLCTDADFLRSSPHAVDFVWGVMLEIVGLAQALKIEGIDEKLAEWQFSRAKKRTVGVTPSMLQDVKANRPFEVEAIVGNTVRLARENGVKMPLLDAIYALAKGLFDAGERSRQ